jgi:hypothetical protein
MCTVLFSKYHPSLQQSITQGGIPHCLLHPSNARASIALEDFVLHRQVASFNVCSDTKVSREHVVLKRRDPTAHCNSAMSYQNGNFRHAAAWISELSCFCLIRAMTTRSMLQAILQSIKHSGVCYHERCYNVHLFSIKSGCCNEHRCYYESRGMLSDDAACACAWRVQL